MIPIVKGPAPHFFSSVQARHAAAEFASKRGMDLSSLRQSRAQFRFPHLRELKEALFHESNGKCVYCEQLLRSPQLVQVEHFRPIHGAIDSRGQRSDRHYFWLAYAWDNLYAACPQCNLAKGSKFPVSSERAPLHIADGLDEIERPLLLNPARCEPDVHLQFHPNGHVAPRTIEGEQTIAILKLNRSELVELRAMRIDHLLQHADPTQAHALFQPNAEFAGAARQIARDLKRDPAWLLDRRRVRPLGTELAAPSASPILTEETPLPAHDEDEKYYASFPLISSIQIAGLFGFTTLKLDIPAGKDGRTACFALLGENGVGKSSILKGLALALYEGNPVEALALNVDDLLNPGVAAGAVYVFFDTGELRSIYIKRDGSVQQRPAHSPILLLGYGATRLLPTPAHPKVAEAGDAKVGNLFDPYVPLAAPGEWLASLSDERFDFAAAAIGDLLDLPTDCYLRRTGKTDAPIALDIQGDSHPLERLSQGYKSVLALACDVMATLFQRWESIDAAQGIVLIDELENHLHPVWKMRIVSSLRRAFPRVQFVVTTHDPLCLRGLESGEVAILRRSRNEGGEPSPLQSLPPVSEMRIDQILTSSYFGLRSTIDPEIEELFDEYYALLDREDSLTDEEDLRLAQLRDATSKFDLPALLPRDRVMYAAIDRYLAQRSAPIPDEDAQFDGDLLAFIDDLVSSMAAEEPPAP